MKDIFNETILILFGIQAAGAAFFGGVFFIGYCLL